MFASSGLCHYSEKKEIYLIYFNKNFLFVKKARRKKRKNLLKKKKVGIGRRISKL